MLEQYWVCLAFGIRGIVLLLESYPQSLACVGQFADFYFRVTAVMVWSLGRMSDE